MVHPTSPSSHIRIATVVNPARGIYELNEASGARTGGPTRRIHRGNSRPEVQRRLGAWLDFYRARGFHDQLMLPAAWQGWVAAIGGMTDPGLPADRLGRWCSVPVEALPLRTLRGHARSGDYRVELLPAIPSELRRVWLVGHPDGRLDLRESSGLEALRPSGSLGSLLRRAGRELRSMAPYVIEAAVIARGDRLVGEPRAMDLLMSAGERLGRLDYRERERHLGELLARDADGQLLQLDLPGPRRLGHDDIEGWSRVRLVPNDCPYDPADPDSTQFVLRAVRAGAVKD